MTTFFEANQVKLSLKMKLSNYSWYEGASVLFEEDKFFVLVSVSRITSKVKKAIPNKVNNVIVRLIKKRREIR